MRVQVVRVLESLPEGFAALRAEAAGEGFNHVENLARGWASGEQRFEGEGEALFAVFADGELAGIGGVTREHLDPALGAMRMRRCCVRERFRRRGLGRTLAAAMVQQGLAFARILTVNAGTPDAPAFWRAMGFRPDARSGRTHVLEAQ
jgi:GNAT superfamily N-acetyltransferase